MQWYYARQGRRFGPVPLPELQRLATNGALQPTDLVIQAGAQQWVTAATVDELFPPVMQAVASTGPAGPPPLPPPGAVVLHAQPTGGRRVYVDDDAGPAVPAWLAAIPQHVGRAFAGDLRRLSVTPSEEKVLSARGMAHPSMRRYYAWRRSVLFVACLPSLLLAILATIDDTDLNIPNLSGFGRLWFGLKLLAPFALPLAAVAAALTWSRPRASSRILIVGWLVAFLVPLALFLVPGHWLFDFGLDNALERARELAHTVFGVVWGLALSVYLWVFLPVFILSAASGVRQACLQLKTLLPASAVPGLFLAATGLVLPLVLFPFFVLVVQIASSPLLLLGIPLLMASALTYTFGAGPFVRPLKSAADYASLKRVTWLARGLFWGGVLFLLIYALTKEWPWPREGALKDLLGAPSGHQTGVDPSKLLESRTLLGFSEDTSFFRPWSWRIFRWLVVEMLGRSLFTSVVFADLFMGVSLRVWRHTRQPTDGAEEENYEQLMGTINKTKD